MPDNEEKDKNIKIKETKLDSEDRNLSEEEYAQKEFNILEDMINQENNLKLELSNNIEDNNIKRIINYDDKRFIFTKKQLYIDNSLKEDLNKSVIKTKEKQLEAELKKLGYIN